MPLLVNVHCPISFPTSKLVVEEERGREVDEWTRKRDLLQRARSGSLRWVWATLLDRFGGRVHCTSVDSGTEIVL